MNMVKNFFSNVGNKIKNAYSVTKTFISEKIKDDEGAEMIEIAIGICLAVVLIVVVMTIVNKAKSKSNEASGAIDKINIDYNVDAQATQ